MEKRIYTVLFCLLLFVLCSCDEKNKGELIGFNSIVDDVVSKSIVQGISDLQSEGMSIYGVRTPSEGSASIVFDNNHLSYDPASATLWSYDGDLKYWISGSNYDFISLFPYSTTDYTFNATAKNVSFDYESALSADQRDVLSAYHARSYTSGGDHSPVPLNMKHTCASLTFRMRNVSNDVVSISNISLTGLYYLGTCTVGSTVSWVTTGEIVAETATSRYAGLTAGLSSLPVSVSTWYDMFSDRILVVPQRVNNNPEIALRVHISFASGTSQDIVAHLANSNEVTAWVAGTSYVYTLSVTEERIVFEVVVEDWTEDHVTL